MPNNTKITKTPALQLSSLATFDEDKLPIEGQNNITFRANATYAWVTFVNSLKAFNTLINQTNALSLDLTSKQVQTSSNTKIVQDDRVFLDNLRVQSASTLAILQNIIGDFTSAIQEPSSPNIGSFWFDSSTKILKVYDGSFWQGVSVPRYSPQSEKTFIFEASLSKDDFINTLEANYYLEDDCLSVFFNGLKLLISSDYTLKEDTSIEDNKKYFISLSQNIKDKLQIKDTINITNLGSIQVLNENTSLEQNIKNYIDKSLREIQTQKEN